MGEEIELKLEIPFGAAEALLGLHWLGRDWKTKKQSSVYFDTPNHDVRKHGHTLRVRAVDGRFIQTVNSLEGGGARPLQRGEWEHQIDGPDPDDERLRHTPLASLDA